MHLRAEDGEQDAEEAVDAHLGHGAGEQDGGTGGSFGVGGGQPGVEGNEGDFDGEAEEGAGEEQQGEVLRREAMPGEVGDDGRHELVVLRERGEVDEVEFVSREEDGEEGQQHGDRADHGVDEELGGSLGAARPSPEADEEECGDEAEFPVEKEVEEVERGEGSEEAGLKQEHEGEVEGGALLNVPGGGNADGDDDGAEEEHEQAEAVDAGVVFDAEQGNPGDALLELECAGGAVVVEPEEESEREGGEAEGEGGVAG